MESIQKILKKIERVRFVSEVSLSNYHAKHVYVIFDNIEDD